MISSIKRLIWSQLGLLAHPQINPKCATIFGSWEIDYQKPANQAFVDVAAREERPAFGYHSENR
jgi:hypothetical protein